MSDKKISNGKKIDTVVFDFDGTLLDTNEVIIESWQHAARELLGHELSKDTLKMTLGEPIPFTVSYLFPDMEPDLVINTYREFHYEHFEEMIKQFPGVQEMLDALQSEGYKLGIVTNRMRRTTEIGLKQFDLMKYFGAIVTLGEAPKDKPAPEHIWFTLDKLGSSPDKAILVGDSQNDMIGGHNAGLISVKVSWAVAMNKSPEKHQEPDHEIETPAELIELIGELNG